MTCRLPAQGDEHTLFDDLEFSMDQGQIVDLVGPSGVGKSTFLMGVAQLDPHCTGELSLEGRDAGSYGMRQWRVLVSYLPQSPMLIGATVADVIRMPWRFAVRRQALATSRRSRAFAAARELVTSKSGVVCGPDDDEIRGALDDLGCADIELHRPSHDLSGGQMARVSLCRTLLTRPKVLLADEVDSGLDDDNAAKVAETMRIAAQRGTSIIRVRHRAPDGLADRIVTLSEGRLL
ncbi:MULTISPECIES: ABC transporter ATP-binding protein [Bifidobacterium]|jgi:putative ABC transport system ATP-binding protein|uniref:ABC transporter ATP-binding protein n=1 Tax=Bifidobacterium TaxID=1678 RepID=UPI0023553BF8|nr:ATP-binding cassette domain-containing protein [Bifidobacterium tibiigranuli]MCI1211988.1 ATP-binding cassette domain-containing protein [Bifidobacterium tibiigranuli]MCI1221740.1 ATP-binding cassette domain-containing protein [Bifidobacterium tibiigranuli]MCI1232584.1 ATP-binding cassette domain-containing protein [Bifidobacterium tibiigranuli]MCI1253912.1 ATP-binding cassette domain-containing protein [Bifidobacterium tibiigranuli]